MSCRVGLGICWHQAQSSQSLVVGKGGFLFHRGKLRPGRSSGLAKVTEPTRAELGSGEWAARTWSTSVPGGMETDGAGKAAVDTEKGRVCLSRRMGAGDAVTLKRALMPWLTWVLETEDSVYIAE